MKLPAAEDPSRSMSNRTFAESGSGDIWRILERFYRSRFHFLRIYDRYEELVAGYVEQLGIPREQIRLQPQELSQLLSYKELEVLRDEFLQPLKDACHALFRTRDTTEFLDRVVNDIFHELSILKEEHYNVLTYEAESRESNADSGLDEDDSSRSGEIVREQQAVLDEVHDVFPQKVHRLHHLFEVALQRFEAILPNYSDNQVLIRSLFLHRDRFVSQAYERGLVDFYELMYGEKRIFEGYKMVGDSFYRSGFYEFSVLCFDEGEQYLQGIPPNAKRTLDPSYKATRDHFRRQRKKAKKHLQALEEGTAL